MLLLCPVSIGIAVKSTADAARGAVDINSAESGLSTVIHSIRGSRQIFPRIRNCFIYTCAVPTRVVVYLAILAFAYEFDFPPFIVPVIALLNDDTIMAHSVDRALPLNTPDAWYLAEIFALAVASGLYLTLSTIALVIVILETQRDVSGRKDHNDRRLHMIMYFQIVMITQALTFIARLHGILMERLSTALLNFSAIAQPVYSIITAYADWSFTDRLWRLNQYHPDLGHRLALPF